MPRMAATRTAAATMSRFNQCMSVLIFATFTLISVRQASRCSSFMFSPPSVYYPVIHSYEEGVWTCRAVKRQRLIDAAVQVDPHLTAGLEA